jgi:hypothetical protein
MNLCQPSAVLPAAAAGQFVAVQGKTGACTPCPAGYAVATDGNSECDICGPGTYQDQAGQSACAVRVY